MPVWTWNTPVSTCIHKWIVTVYSKGYTSPLPPQTAKMDKGSCNLEVKQLLLNTAASSQMLRPVLCQPQILGKHLSRESTSSPKLLLCWVVLLYSWEPSLRACLLCLYVWWLGGRGGCWGEIHFYGKTGWLVSAQPKVTLVTPSTFQQAWHSTELSPA